MMRLHTYILAIFIIAAPATLSAATGEGVVAITGEAVEDFRLYHLLVEKGVIDSEIQQLVELGIVRKLMLLKTLNVNTKKLNGNELRGLCELVTYTEKTKLPEAARKDKQLVQMALEYSNNVSQEIFTEVKRYQSTLGGEGCKIGWGQ